MWRFASLWILPSHFPTGYYAIQVKEKKVKKEKQKESIKSGLGLIVLSTLSHSTRRNRLNGFRDYNRGNSRLINSVHGMNNATLIDNKRGNGIREGGLFQSHSCFSRRSRGWRADFFSLFLLFLLRGNVIFKKKAKVLAFRTRSYPPPSTTRLEVSRCEDNLYALGTFKKLSMEDHFSCSCLFCYGRSPRWDIYD